jgi:hypothetical protein
MCTWFLQEVVGSSGAKETLLQAFCVSTVLYKALFQLLHNSWLLNAQRPSPSEGQSQIILSHPFCKYRGFWTTSPKEKQLFSKAALSSHKKKCRILLL